MRFCLDRAEERRLVEDVDTPRYSFSMNGFVLARGSCSIRVLFFFAFQRTLPPHGTRNRCLGQTCAQRPTSADRGARTRTILDPSDSDEDWWVGSGDLDGLSSSTLSSDEWERMTNDRPVKCYSSSRSREPIGRWTAAVAVVLE